MLSFQGNWYQKLDVIIWNEVAFSWNDNEILLLSPIVKQRYPLHSEGDKPFFGREKRQ